VTATTVRTGAELEGETVELLQQLIRNQCVNDGRPESGHEGRSSDVLRTYLEGGGLELETFEPTPGRVSLVTRIEGTDPAAPTLCLCGHTDVVPVTPSQWRRDPFGGELVDGEVWGRGAIDMLNLTVTMAVAVRALADSGYRPRGTLIYAAVADEEAGGVHGARWLLDHEREAVGADYLITESGGIVSDTAAGRKVSVTVAEKGLSWRTLRVRGAPGHGSMPYGVDNALIKTAEIVRRLAAYRPRPVVSELWRQFVEHSPWQGTELGSALLDPARLDDALAELNPLVGKLAHACTHTTFSPNVIRGGVKTNVIPDAVELDVDIRTLPGDDDAEVEAHLRAALGDLAEGVEMTTTEHGHSPASESPTGTPLWDALETVVRRAYPDATLLPRLTVGGTDARFWRQTGAVAYGFGLFSPAVTFSELSTRFHGVDERVDVESLVLTTQAWLDLLTLD
jgi:acetylornithine deacetylase/succinyl-diaminopimelate desuccinylase-like protein